MPLDSRTVLDAMIQVLRNNTATMAASLTTATDIKTIKAGDARSLPVGVDEYPALLVKLLREEEEFHQIGQRNNMHQLEFAVVPVLYHGASAETSDRDVITLTKNTKGVLKSNITLSGTALWLMPTTVDYFATELDGVYCSASIITVRTNHLST